MMAISAPSPAVQNGSAAASSSSSATLPTATDFLPHLRAHNAAFTKLLNLIPSRYYLNPDDGLDIDGDDPEAFANLNTKYMKNKKKAAGITTEQKQLAKEKRKAKLDPSNLKTTSDVQKERAQRAELKKRKRDGVEGGDDMEMSLEVDGLDESGEGESDSQSDGPANGDAAARLAPVSQIEVAPQSHQDSIATLRERLQSKIARMQGRRGNGDVTGANAIALGGSDSSSFDAEDDGDISVASTRDELLEERRRKRGEVRDNRRRARKEMRRQAAANAAQQNGRDKKSTASGSGPQKNGSRGQPFSAPGLLVNESSDKKASGSSAFRPSESDINFSSLQFNADKSSPSSKAKRDRNALPSDPKQALEILQARKRKAAEAAAADGGEGGSSSTGDDSALWSKALSASKGVKIRDDEALLKKAIKKKEKAKGKSATEWNDRKRAVKEAEADKQKKRTENLQARKDAKKNKKMGIKDKTKKTGGAMGGGKKTKDRKFGAGGGSGSGGSSGGRASGGRAGFEGKRFGKSASGSSGGRGGRKGGSSGGAGRK